jgi:methylmalonyl-CoA/ethylmalonyl-CoA epimerase
MMSFSEASNVFHWGYVVRNMERAIKIWTAQGAGVIVEPAVDPIQNVVCSLLIYRNAIPIELIAPMPSGPNPVASRLAKGGGLDHVCLFSDSLENDVAKMESQGEMVVVSPCYGAVFDRQLAFILTRTGLVVELMSRAPTGKLQIDPIGEYLADQMPPATV